MLCFRLISQRYLEYVTDLLINRKTPSPPPSLALGFPLLCRKSRIFIFVIENHILYYRIEKNPAPSLHESFFDINKNQVPSRDKFEDFLNISNFSSCIQPHQGNGCSDWFERYLSLAICLTYHFFNLKVVYEHGFFLLCNTIFTKSNISELIQFLSSIYFFIILDNLAYPGDPRGV